MQRGLKDIVIRPITAFDNVVSMQRGLKGYGVAVPDREENICLNAKRIERFYGVD